MQTQNTPREERAWPELVGLPPGLPERSEIQQVAFVTGDNAEQATLMEFKEPRSCRAVLMTRSAEQTAPDMTLLLVLTSDQEDPELAAKVWSWVEPEVPPDVRRGFLITLQGARIIWSPGRAAIIASADRLEALRRAVVQFSFQDGEVRDIERELAQAWPHLEEDAPLAFHIGMWAKSRREELAQRFQQMLGLRTRLARINPVIHHPPIHPPTLASQLSERLKERTRLSERVEFISEQIGVFERVYEMCGQRSGEVTIARSQALLEWMIIILIAMQTIFSLLDLMSSKSAYGKPVGVVGLARSVNWAEVTSISKRAR
jgi:hypothetical protein